MGTVSAEASGYIRTELSRLGDKSYPFPSIDLLKCLHPALRKLETGKRLTDAEVDDALAAAMNCLPPHTTHKERHIYLAQVDGRLSGADRNFDDKFAQLRAVHVECGRRRISFSDYPLGALFSFHSLVRMHERHPTNSKTMEVILDAMPLLCAHLMLLRIVNAGGKVCVPFAEGLAFGEYTLVEALVMAVSCSGSRHGYISGDRPIPQYWAGVGGKYIEFRITSYLSVDQLSAKQEMFLARWVKLQE
jgi:hypothetical protein